jgi:hypothetical protein
MKFTVSGYRPYSLEISAKGDCAVAFGFNGNALTASGTVVLNGGGAGLGTADREAGQGLPCAGLIATGKGTR